MSHETNAIFLSAIKLLEREFPEALETDMSGHRCHSLEIGQESHILRAWSFKIDRMCVWELADNKNWGQLIDYHR